MQTKEFHINIPKHLAVRIEDQVIEKFGYKVRGGMTLLILEALEEKFNPKLNKKNGLALKPIFREETNRGIKLASDISMILSDIKDHLQPSEDDSYYISHTNLVNILVRRLGIIDKRGHKNKIKWMTSMGLLTIHQEYKSIGYNKNGFPNTPTLINNYLVNPEFLKTEMYNN